MSDVYFLEIDWKKWIGVLSLSLSLSAVAGAACSPGDAVLRRPSVTILD